MSQWRNLKQASATNHDSLEVLFLTFSQTFKWVRSSVTVGEPLVVFVDSIDFLYRYLLPGVQTPRSFDSTGDTFLILCVVVLGRS